MPPVKFNGDRGRKHDSPAPAVTIRAVSTADPKTVSGAGPGAAITRTGRELALLLIFIAADLGALVAAFRLAFAARQSLLPVIFSALDHPLQPFIWHAGDYLKFAPALLLWPAAFSSEGLYRARRVFWEEARHILRAATLAFVAALLFAFAFHVKDELSRPLMVMTVLLGALGALALRRGLRRLLRDAALYRRPALLVAAPAEAEKILRLFARERALGYVIAGVMSPEVAAPPDGAAKVLATNFPLHISLDENGAAAMARCGARDLVVCNAGLPSERLAEILEETAGLAQQVRMVPDLAGLPLTGLEAEALGDVPVLNIPQNLTSPASLVTKRLFDLAVALPVLILCSPLLAALWLWIRFDSPGAPLLRQPRLARGGGTFDCWKFRSMFLDGDDKLESHLAGDPGAATEWREFQKLKGDDPRVTRAGRWLRKLSFDELPQLINIVTGDMSLCGPRPYLPREIATMGRHAPIILRARPGITGLWQVSGRNALTFAQRLQLDEYYVRNWSLWTDITLLLRTPAALLKGGAY